MASFANGHQKGQNSLSGVKKIYFHLDNFIKMKQNISVAYRCVAQFGRALRSGRRGRRFKSCHTDKKRNLFRFLFYFLIILFLQLQKFLLRIFCNILCCLLPQLPRFLCHNTDGRLPLHPYDVPLPCVQRHQ